MQNLKTVAVLEGDHYVVSGQKKWISGAPEAHYFTMLVRTGKKLTLLLVERNLPGLNVRRMDTMGHDTHQIGFVTLEVIISKNKLKHF